jgi:two-component system sensor histidine kinase VicK
MIRNLLEQEFLESASAELVRRRVNIVAIVREMLKGYKQSEETLQRTFNFSTATEIIHIDIDETKIAQAFNNLVSNAIKFTQENGIIDVSIKEEDSTILLTVSDNGIGIPEKYHAGLFEKFTKKTWTSWRSFSRFRNVNNKVYNRLASWADKSRKQGE